LNSNKELKMDERIKNEELRRKDKENRGKNK